MLQPTVVKGWRKLLAGGHMHPCWDLYTHVEGGSSYASTHQQVRFRCGDENGPASKRGHLRRGTKSPVVLFPFAGRRSGAGFCVLPLSSRGRGQLRTACTRSMGIQLKMSRLADRRWLRHSERHRGQCPRHVCCSKDRVAVKRATWKIRPQRRNLENHKVLLSARCYARHLVCPMAPVAESVVGSCADNGEVNEVVPLADKSCTLTIIQRVVEYLKKHAEFEAQGAEDEV
jgi:hypothetical protein